jgi:hypothetical protein
LNVFAVFDILCTEEKISKDEYKLFDDDGDEISRMLYKMIKNLES